MYKLNVTLTFLDSVGETGTGGHSFTFLTHFKSYTDKLEAKDPGLKYTFL